MASSGATDHTSTEQPGAPPGAPPGARPDTALPGSFLLLFRRVMTSSRSPVPYLGARVRILCDDILPYLRNATGVLTASRDTGAWIVTLDAQWNAYESRILNRQGVIVLRPDSFVVVVVPDADDNVAEA